MRLASSLYVLSRLTRRIVEEVHHGLLLGMRLVPPSSTPSRRGPPTMFNLDRALHHLGHFLLLGIVFKLVLVLLGILKVLRFFRHASLALVKEASQTSSASGMAGPSSALDNLDTSDVLSLAERQPAEDLDLHLTQPFQHLRHGRSVLRSYFDAMHDQVDEIGRTAVRSEPFDLAAIEGEGGWEPLQSVKTFVVSIRYNVIRPDTDSENLLLGMYQPSGRDLSKLSIVPYQHAHLSLRSTKG
jgi:hypothetical protein